MYFLVIVAYYLHILGNEDIFSSVGDSEAWPNKYPPQAACAPSAVVSVLKSSQKISI